MDYESSIQIVEFDSAGSHMVPFMTIDDLIVEDTEYFSAHITSSDSFVRTIVEDSVIFITDDGERETGFNSCIAWH